MVLVLLDIGSSVTDVTGTITGDWSGTDVTEPTTEVEGGKRVRIGLFLTLNCERSGLILTKSRLTNCYELYL